MLVESLTHTNAQEKSPSFLFPQTVPLPPRMLVCVSDPSIHPSIHPLTHPSIHLQTCVNFPSHARNCAGQQGCRSDVLVSVLTDRYGKSAAQLYLGSVA